jgi:hypothetical protein
MPVRGRHRFFFWLLAACAALWLVVWRQTDSYRVARALRELRNQRALLEGRRGDLERRIRGAASRDQLIPRAGARLGLREARDSEIFRITVPASTPPSP